MPYKDKGKRREYDKRYRELNKEKIADCKRKHREKNKEKISEYSRKWEEENKEKRREYKRKYREENKEKHREWRSEYYQLNKEKISEYRREQHKERRAQCVEYLGGKCVKCGATHNLQFDHIKREGKKYNIASRVDNNWDNLKEELDKCQLLCYDCHLEKTAQEWTHYKLSTTY